MPVAHRIAPTHASRLKSVERGSSLVGVTFFGVALLRHRSVNAENAAGIDVK